MKISRALSHRVFTHSAVLLVGLGLGWGVRPGPLEVAFWAIGIFSAGMIGGVNLLYWIVRYQTRRDKECPRCLQPLPADDIEPLSDEEWSELGAGAVDPGDGPQKRLNP